MNAWTLFPFAFLLLVILLSSGCKPDAPVTVTTEDLTIRMHENPFPGQELTSVVGNTNIGSVTFALTQENPAGALALEATSGLLTVRDSALFDFERYPTLTATATVTNGSVTANSAIIISLTDIQEGVIAQNETLQMDENPNIGQVITTVSATLTAGSPSYSIKSSSPNNAFELTTTSGEVRVKDNTLFDFEINPSLSIVVSVSNGTDVDEATITVNLNNILEEVNTQDESVSMDENPSNGRHVVTVMGTTDLGSVTFSLASESVAGAFAIDATSGRLTVADENAFDYETNPTLTATVEVKNTNIIESAEITVNLNDVLELSWTQALANAAFGGLYDHKIVEFNNKLWCIGGIRGIDRINEVWSSNDGTTWTKETTSSNIFSPLNAHAVLVFNNKLWVIGGFTDAGRSNAVWSSTNGTSWTQVNTQGIFSPRADHAAIVHNGQIYVVGGSDGVFKDEVWRSADGISWNQVNTNGTTFSARIGHSLTVFNGKMVLIGGADLDAQQLMRQRNDVWMSTDGINWTEASISGNSFSERWLHSATVYEGLLFVIGGDDDTGNRFNDVWTSPDGSTWTQQTASPVFSARDQFAIYRWNQQLFISGGSNNNGILEDIWRAN